ncbi:hypothetical protein ASPWEDRAFT_167781 [Aspergillus wentii DTO 134E9]|uniref:separase n=1 Tax=Aspergillus wentii DTO 134E9 TaxID=1073089 RepID=A0A1L9S3P6_ASPWE|nr:uncharacterized protein ASPWEDRAFT_167781 [Aspergillus wentii DTO 134E9]KAI9930113.1 hypothetical protein MW887_011923 [Aspergillus wentii]OJJ41776.1 hypothetical protein ASPWEDRAFT_167781 [Aspergillus wentii DTO 134E9]
MAVSTLLPDSSVESVKHAVRSTSTCSNATVLALQTLFRGASKGIPEIETSTVRRGAKGTKDTVAATGRTKAVRGATKTKISPKNATINTVVEKDGSRLSCQERLVLATEVFNTTLKTLSDELKLSASKRQLSSADETRSASTNVPLQPSSANRAVKSPKKTKTSKPTQTAAADLESGAPAVAECARMALSCLRTLKSEQANQDACPNVQLEQGSCVLAGRLISLGLNDAAYKELRALKRRIQQYLDTEASDRKKKTETRGTKDAQEDEAVKERMSDLINFANIANARPLHGLLVTYQSNALRLLSSEKKPSTVQNLCPSLQLSDPSNPAKVIMAAVESGSLPSDKAALQLQLLSNTVLSLSSGTQQTNDKNLAPRDRLRPTTALNLQLLSLEIRCMGWKLSGHECEEVREMWDPLARYLAAFAHHSKGLEKSEFALTYKTIVRLQLAFANIKRKPTTNAKDTHSVTRIATIMGQLAQEAGCFEEALKLFTEALAPLSEGQCLALATVRCKMASVHFQALRSSSKYSQSDASTAVLDSTTALGMPLKGNSNDLDELLVEAAKLKKVAMGWLGDAVAKDQNNSDNDEEDELHIRIREYLTSFVRFLRRYVGRQPSQDDEPKDHEAFQKRALASKSIVLAAVDSAVAIGKLSVMSQSPPWEEMISLLSDCQRLLVTMDVTFDKTADSLEVDNTGLGFVKMSNLFWSRYVKEKERGQGVKELLPLLKQSATLLSGCSASQRSTGFAALKFERLAHLYLEAGAGVESEKAFHQSIKEHVDAGVLKQVAADAEVSVPYRMPQDPKSSAFMLSRVLNAFLKMRLRHKGSKARDVFDDKKLSTEQRGLVLEWQLKILTELHPYALSEEHFRALFGTLLSKTLDTYSPAQHPLRRLQTIICAVRFSLEHPGCLDAPLLQQLVKEATTGLTDELEDGEDCDLAPFAVHIKNSLRLALGLHQGNLQPYDLDQLISSWTAMAHGCQDWKAIEACILDIEYWSLQMKAIVDYTEIHGLWKLQISALELVLRITELQESGDFSEAIVVISRLVSQYCRLGHCKKAGSLLMRADRYLNQVSCLGVLSYKLARAEYLLETGDAEQAATVLSAAQVLFEKNQKKQDLNACSVLSKMAWERLVADAAFISSRLSFAQGSITRALFFAKLSVRLNCRIWAKVEKLSQRKQDKYLPTSNSSEIDTVVEGVAKLDVCQTSKPDSSVSYSQGAPFWPHIGSHHTSLLHLANLSAHHGLFQDAIYYGEQALKINKTLNANVRLIASQAQLGSHWILGGHLSEGQDLLAAASTASKRLESSIEIVSLQMSLASLHRAQGHHKDELRALLDAEKVMSDVLVSETADSSSELEDKMENLRIRGTSRRTQTQGTTTVRRTRAGTTSSRGGTKRASPVTADSPVIESNALSQLRTEVLRQQAGCSRTMRDFDNALSLLTEARKYATSRDSQISLHIGESEHLLADAIRNFASHAVYCVLPESTISLPALQSPIKAADEPTPSTVKPSTVRKTRAPAKGTRSRAQKATDDFSVMLSKAGDCLNNVFATATTLGSTLDSHAASRLMSRISMLSHTTAPESPIAWPQSPANVNEIGRIGAFTRERTAIDIDKQLADFSDPLLWPASAISTVELEEDLCSNFTQEYIDILPESWNVLSLSLSADRSEFIVSRLQKDHTPFLLRLPLRRGNSEDDEEEQFTFEDGREEMQELTRLANESSHAARLQTDKNSKKEWWKNREELDRRMETLLQNIESIWFGGFRGIFSPTPREPSPLARFASAFQNILDKCLPSRQKGGRTTGPKLTLHQNVLELFIGVKGLEVEEDPEDTLMDLLYFVVDILQFQGERNAYDEIDFDMMVVETLDALREYHEAVQEEQEQQSPQHTVLILDKALHLFPWESLPCLQGYPVCRVPSLECLRDRVLQFRQERGDNDLSRLGIDRQNGAYILNPAGDLQSTQSTFDEDLSKLDNWTRIVKREPTEDEFKEALESRSVCLYFGHGSGAQYIRGRTIKRLDRCAVTFLMGCSSGSLTEAGEYEPYGTPLNYLQAGSPALVATLWDVTDKDIDRFAQSTFERWGLIGEQSVNVSSSKKGKPRAPKGKGRSAEIPQPISLDEAVCQSRSACVLKYLNGAAPVIYGVPSVFLE